MYKKGHTGMIKVKRATEEKPGTLEIKVRIGGNNADTGNVKDLKQLSGYHPPCVAVCSCYNMSPYQSCSRWHQDGLMQHLWLPLANTRISKQLRKAHSKHKATHLLSPDHIAR